ncbi:hypothetical protein, partial [Bartonella bovis]|uniref:hypothetical protein n=1 Tax=Bartonella bovis TaxID=155194 RepID=UPI00195B67EA
VKVENGVTSARLTSVVIRGTSGQGTGVYVENGVGVGATGTLTKVDISGVGTGVWVKQGTLEMTNGSIEFKGNGDGKGLSIEGTANA